MPGSFYANLKVEILNAGNQRIEILHLLYEEANSYKLFQTLFNATRAECDLPSVSLDHLTLSDPHPLYIEDHIIRGLNPSTLILNLSISPSHYLYTIQCGNMRTMPVTTGLKQKLFH